MSVSKSMIDENHEYREETVDVIVPVLNEREMLPRFIQRIDALGLPLNMIFVDNGSDDGTAEYLRERADVRLIEHGRNLGYGRSLVDGMKAATARYLIIIDADCEYPPEALPGIIKALDSGAAAVYASRFLGSGAVDMPWARAWGNRCLTAVFNRLYRQQLTDLYTGMKGLRRDIVADMAFSRDGFEHVAELAAHLARRGYAIEEVPVEYSPRRSGRSKMKHIPELFKAMSCLLRCRLVRHA